MDNRGMRKSQHTRPPLSDATHRVANAPTQYSGKPITQVRRGEESAPKNRSSSRGHHQSVAPECETTLSSRVSASAAVRGAPGPTTDPNADKRASQISTSSGASSSKRKTHVGPWHLGKTLGKGSAGRVRLARHSETGEDAAVKILPKHGVRLTQAGSLQDIDAWDQSKDDFKRQNRMPLSIERESGATEAD
ncbi:Serine/threonine-protein kinase HSL1 [Apiospora phragmitis]|uniref:Serine/threonine-protein kinase HSL1 n=1 Tax=Apiospora phragmitis TaxID=2905665 RepID=A0ABR1TQ13_9PEZI